ncbi:MAG: acyl-CoA dehydrogenase family protein [Legionellales bacterium]|nr:acyl-CoA dehydrogenase family protein [Legionellales bacterium]
MDLFFTTNDFCSAEEQAIQESVADFASKELSLEINEAFENGYFPKELIPKFAKLGLFGINLPNPYGLDLSKLAYGLVCYELEKIDSAYRSFISVQNSLVMFPIYEYGNDLQKSTYLPKLASGEFLGCFALTEPDHGSDPSGMETSAKKIDGKWIINGVKAWITNAPIANVIICWARTDDGIRGFLVDSALKGVTINEMKHKMSLRASITGEIVFDNVAINEDCMLPGTEIGLVAALQCLTRARFGICFGAIGAAMDCFKTTLDYAKNRKQFNKSIASYQLIQKDLVDMYQELIKSQLLNIQLANNFMTKDWHIQVSLAKRNACRVALSIARNSRNILGANGIMLEYNVIRHLLNLETVFTYEGTDNIHTLIV